MQLNRPERLIPMTHATTATSQPARFAECVYERNDIVEIRRLPSGRSSWHVAAELQELVAQLKVDNVNGQCVHVGINPRKERGGRKTTDVVLARCLFADFDNVELDEAIWRSFTTEEPSGAAVVSLYSCK